MALVRKENQMDINTCLTGSLAILLFICILPQRKDEIESKGGKNVPNNSAFCLN